MILKDIQAALREQAACRRREADELERWADEIARRKPVKRGPRNSRSMTPELEREAREMYLNNPDLTQHDVGTILGINPGRVSEAVRGKRS
jgi:hypothetical protein